MVNFTVQHILVMRLITQYTFPSINFLHTLLFLASAEDLEQHDIGFYDFVRTPKGAFSFNLQAVTEELIRGALIDRETLKLTEKGHNAYYALARVLQPFEDYWARCMNCINRSGDFEEMHRSLKTNVLYRKAKINGQLFPEATTF